MKYVYPVILTKNDKGYLVEVPDLLGCYTFGDDLYDAIDMARDAVSMWLCNMEDGNEEILKASDVNCVDENQITTLIDVDTIAYRKQFDNKAVKKTLTIPSWLNAKAERAGVNFSQVLQKALIKELGID